MENSQRFGALDTAPDPTEDAQWKVQEGYHFCLHEGPQKGMSWSEREGFESRPSNSSSDLLFTALVLERALCSLCFPSWCSARPCDHNCVSSQLLSAETAPLPQTSRAASQGEPPPPRARLALHGPSDCATGPHPGMSLYASCSLRGTCQACARQGLSSWLPLPALQAPLPFFQ